VRKHQHKSNYKEGSLSLIGAVAMGTGVMIGAGIFALTGQVAELAREWFPLAFIIAAMILANRFENPQATLEHLMRLGAERVHS